MDVRLGARHGGLESPRKSRDRLGYGLRFRPAEAAPLDRRLQQSASHSAFPGEGVALTAKTLRFRPSVLARPRSVEYPSKTRRKGLLSLGAVVWSITSE